MSKDRWAEDGGGALPGEGGATQLGRQPMGAAGSLLLGTGTAAGGPNRGDGERRPGRALVGDTAGDKGSRSPQAHLGTHRRGPLPVPAS